MTYVGLGNLHGCAALSSHTPTWHRVPIRNASLLNGLISCCTKSESKLCKNTTWKLSRARRIATANVGECHNSLTFALCILEPPSSIHKRRPRTGSYRCPTSMSCRVFSTHAGVNIWEKPTAPAEWKAEQMVLVTLAGCYGLYAALTSGGPDAMEVTLEKRQVFLLAGCICSAKGRPC